MINGENKMSKYKVAKEYKTGKPRIRNVSWEKSPQIKAMVDIETPDGIVIKDCKVIDGQYGMYIASPSIKAKEPWVDKNGKTHEWNDVVYFPREVQDELTAMISDAYDPQGQYAEGEMPF